MKPAYRPYTKQLKERIELILTESINEVEPARIDLYIIKTTNKLMELFLVEMEYGPRFR